MILSTRAVECLYITLGCAAKKIVHFIAGEQYVQGQRAVLYIGTEVHLDTAVQVATCISLVPRSLRFFSCNFVL